MKPAIVSLLVLAGTSTSSLAATPSVSVGKVAHAIKSPKPTYPYEARRHGIGGSGLFILRIEIKTGQVTRVTIAKSTGNSLLDDAAVTALKYWRFQPDKLTPIRQLLPNVNDSRRDEDSLAKVPVTFISLTSPSHGRSILP